MTTAHLTVEQLQQRYDITRRPLYNRISALNIKLGKIKGKAIASTEQIAQLDQLHEHLSQGGTLNNFVPTAEIVIEDDTAQHNTTQLDENYSDKGFTDTAQHSTTQQGTTQTAQLDENYSDKRVTDTAQSDTTQHSTALATQEGESSQSLSVVETAQHNTTQFETTQLMEVIKLLAENQRRSPVDRHQELQWCYENGIVLTTAEIKEIIGVKPYCKNGANSYQRGTWVFTKAGRIGGSIAWEISKQSKD